MTDFPSANLSNSHSVARVVSNREENRETLTNAKYLFVSRPCTETLKPTPTMSIRKVKIQGGSHMGPLSANAKSAER